MRIVAGVLVAVLSFSCAGCGGSSVMTEEEYLEKGKYIWKNYVPKSGQSEFVQGELLRASVKLRDEAHRNGNANWDESHELLVNYLLSTIRESNILAEEKLTAFEADINRILKYDDPYLEDDLFDRLDNIVVDYFMENPEPIPHKANPNLYR